MMTAQERDAEYADQLGRCESCATLVHESELVEFERVLYCGDCANAYGIQS